VMNSSMGERRTPASHSSSEMWERRNGIRAGHQVATILATCHWTFAPCLNKNSARLWTFRLRHSFIQIGSWGPAVKAVE
jgi:hypothetical protein